MRDPRTSADFYLSTLGLDGADAGVHEVAWEDSEGYAGVEVRDPDDYVVELAYDLT